MATQNDFIVQEIGNKVLYIEPNFVGGGRDNVPVPLEDLSIYVELRVEYNRVITQRQVINDSQEIILQYQKRSQNESYISLYNGTKIGDDVFLSTQGYGNYTLNSITKEGTEELFGIETIDISYNSFAVPEVNIKFTDIKGAALHAAEELAHDENGNLTNNASLSCKFLSCFFTVPYPRFKLAVKGFYGEPVYYELTCADLRSSFNSKSGNYDLNVHLVGYAFGLISDINMCSLIAASNCTYVGSEYWDNEVKSGRFKVGDSPMPKLTDIIKLWNNKKTITKDDINEFSNYNVVNYQECFKKVRILIYDILEQCVDKWKNHSVYIDNYPVVMATDVSGMYESSIVAPLEDRMKERCQEIFKEYGISVAVPYFIVITITGKNFTKDIIKEKLLLAGWQGGFNDDFLTEAMELITSATTRIHIVDARDKIQWCDEMINKGTTLSVQKFALKEKILQEKFKKEIGFYPSIENMTRICFAHLETFLYMFEHVRTTQQTINGVLFPKVLENVTNLDGVMRYEEVWLDKVFKGEREESKIVKGISEGLKVGITNSIDSNMSLVGNIVAHPSDLLEHCFKYLYVDKKLNIEVFQERVRFLFTDYATNNYCTLIPEEFGKQDAMAFLKYNPFYFEELGEDLRLDKFIDTKFIIINDDYTYKHLKPHNIVCYDALNDNVINKQVLGVNAEDKAGFFKLNLHKGWDSTSFNKDIFINPKSGFLFPKIKYDDNKYYFGLRRKHDHQDMSSIMQQDYVLGRGNVDRSPRFKGEKWTSYLNYESCTETNWETLAHQSSLMTIINVYFYGSNVMYDESKSLFAKDTLYSSLTDLYAKAYMFLLSFRFFKHDDNMKIQHVIDEILFNGNFKEVKEVSRTIEAIPYFLYLLIGSIFYLNKNRNFTDFSTWDVEIFNISDEYQEYLMNDFKKWADEKFKKWDDAFTIIRDAGNSIHEASNQAIARKYCLGHIGGNNPTIFLFDPQNAIVKEMTEDFFKCVWLVKYGKGIYKNSHFPYKLRYEKDVAPIFKKYASSFEKTLKQYFDKELEDEASEKYNFSTSSEFINLNIYRYLKQIWDRWLVTKKLGFDRWTMEEVFGKSRKRIHFIDASYNDVGQYIICDIGKFVELLLVCQEQEDMPFLTFLSYFYRDNNCILNNVQNFLNFQDKKAINKIFKPKTLLDVNLEENCFSDIVVLYSFQPSATLDDGFDINEIIDLPQQYRTNRGYKIPAFGVAYGMQNQNYFFDVNVSMNTPNVTDQSIQATLQIAEENSPGGTSDSTIQIRSMSNDMYKVYGNHAYQCTVVMMGCAWIQPLMYFQLLNVPLFRGAYIIHKVTHNISSNNMKTTIVGTKISKISAKSLETCFNMLNRQVIQQENKVFPQNMTHITNDCYYKFYPLWEDEDHKNKDMDKIIKKHLEMNYKGLPITYAHYYVMLMFACFDDQQYEIDGEKYDTYDHDKKEFINVLSYSPYFKSQMMEFCICLLYNKWRREVHISVDDDMDNILALEDTIKGMISSFDLFENIAIYDTESYINGYYLQSKGHVDTAAQKMVKCFNGEMPIPLGYKVSDVKKLTIQAKIADKNKNTEYVKRHSEYVGYGKKCMDINAYTYKLKDKDVTNRVVGKCCFDNENAFMYDNNNAYPVYSDPYPMYCFLANGNEMDYVKYERNYSIDDLVDCLNNTLKDSEKLKDVSISVVLKDDNTKTFLLKINKNNAGIKTQVFDMILQTYYGYLSDLSWVVTNAKNCGKVWEYIGGTLYTQGSNNVSMTRVCLLKDKNKLQWETIESHENLHKDFYTSLIKRYEILKNDEKKYYYVQDAFAKECKNFIKLTNQLTWKAKVLEFFNKNNITKNIIIQDCIQVMEGKIDELENTFVSDTSPSTTPSTTTTSMKTTDISLLEKKRKVTILSTPQKQIEGGPPPLTNYTQHEGDGMVSVDWMQQKSTKNQLQQFINGKCPGGEDSCMSGLTTTFGYNKTKSATARKSGRCWEYVHKELTNSLECITTGRPNSACRAWQVLDWWGFERVYYGMTKDFTDGFQNGDIIITEGLNVNKSEHAIHGHIQVYYEGNWYSDINHGANPNVYASKDGGCDRPCFIYRIKKKDNIT